MQNEYKFARERDARDFAWEVLKLGESATIDKVSMVLDASEFRWAVEVRYWSEQVETALEQHAAALEEAGYADSPSDRDEMREAARGTNARDALILTALAQSKVLKSKLIDDAEGCDAVDDLAEAVAKVSTMAAPGPSSAVYNFAMEQLDKDKRIGEVR